MKIFSVHAKRTDFLRHHVESLRYFCKDNFEYFCIDNFMLSEQSEFIKKECENLNVNYIRSSHNITGTAWDHAPALNSIKNYTSNSDLNIILEFDIFLINQFSFRDYISGYDISGIYQQRHNFEQEYVAPFIFITNKNNNFSEIDFDGANGCDVGGNTQYYIKNKKVKWMKHTPALIGDNDCFTIPYDNSFGCQIIESSFIHYYRGTNWDNRSNDYEKLKTEWFVDALKKSKEQSILNDTYLDKYQTPYSHAFKHWNGSNDFFNSKLNPYLNT
jgi:hypothetical protein